MNTKRLIMVAAVAASVVSVLGVLGQNVPGVHGSLDAMTVVTTQPAAATQGALPAGHAAIGGAGSQMMTEMHQGVAAAKSGALRVIVAQGTKDGPAIGKDAVRVELLSQGSVIKTILGALDEKGVLELHDLPLDVAFQPVVTVLHAGSEQQKVGASMHKFQPAIEFDMPVFETTEVKPEWSIGLRDVEASAVVAEDGKTGMVVRLVDMIGGFSPSDKAWVGEKGQIMAVGLPEGATNVQFGPGMAEAGAKVAGDKVVRGKTMLPGSTEYMFAYDVAVKDGKATVSFTAPAETTLFALYVPGDWKVLKTDGLEVAAAGGTHAAGKSQLIKARSVKAGAVISLELGGITATATSAAASQPAEVMDHTTDLHLPGPGKK